jgi:hypothetical protein
MDSVVSPAAAAQRLAALAHSLRSRQLGVDDDARFGGIYVPTSALCPSAEQEQPSVHWTCAAIWAWGAAIRSSGNLSRDAAPLVQLCHVARDSAWSFVEHAETVARRNGGPVPPSTAACLLLACASELLLGDAERAQPVAQRAVTDLTAFLKQKQSESAPGEVPRPWLCVPLLLYAHACNSEPLTRAGQQCVLDCTAFPELPLCWWDSEPTAQEQSSCPLSLWAGSVVAAIVACQGEPETIPWCSRIAAAALPQHVNTESTSEHSWAHTASHVMALQALQRALPHGWVHVRRVQNACAKLAGDALRVLDEAQANDDTGLAGRLAMCFALYGFSVEPGGPRVCC